jgi:hypothetical protein
MSTFPTHQRRPSRKEVEQALSPLDFPLQKEELVRCVETDLADPDGDAVVHQLRALPLATYESADEVLGSVELADQLGP